MNAFSSPELPLKEKEEDRLPISSLFAPTEYLLPRSQYEDSRKDLLHDSFYRSLLGAGADLPLTPDGRKIMGGFDQFATRIRTRRPKGSAPLNEFDELNICIKSCKDNPYFNPYYLGIADLWIIQNKNKWIVDGRSYLNRVIGGSNFIELGSGDAQKVLWYLTHTKDRRYWPANIILNDIGEDNLRGARQSLINVGYLEKNIHLVPGDFTKKATWNTIDGLLYRLNLARADSAQAMAPTTIGFFGSTWDDQTLEERRILLDHYYDRAIKDKLANRGRARFLSSIDFTQDKNTLRAAYDTPQVKHFALTAAYWHFREKPSLREQRAECTVEILDSSDKRSQLVQITIVVSMAGKKFKHPFEAVEKPDFTNFAKEIGDFNKGIAGHIEIEKEMRYRSTPHPNAHASIVGLTLA